MSEIDEQFVEYVVKSLVSKPDAVHIDRRIDEKGVLLELTVDPEDLGRVIGKRGATAQSLRTLLRALGTKNDARYNLKIIDNGAPRPTTNDSTSSSSTDDNGVSDNDSTTSEESNAPTPENNQEEASGVEDDPPVEENDSGASDRLQRTREELADLDDLDV